MSLTPEYIASCYQELGVEEGQRLAVAVSGGADSLCLLLLSASKFNVTAITVDHGLRADAAEEAVFVAGICRDRDIEHVILHWEGEKPKSNIQANARAARYKLMEEWCAANDMPFLATAHHRDDQAETLLLRLARGSGVYGLASMPSSREIGSGVTLLRPLLDVPKEDILSTMKALNQPWVDDPSNTSDAYDRVKVREFLSNPPLEGLNTERLAATAGRLRRTRDALEHYERLWKVRALSVQGYGSVLIKRQELSSEPEEIILRGLASLCRFFNGGGYVPRMEKLLRLKEALIRDEFNGHTLYGIQFAALDEFFILATREVVAVAGEVYLEKSMVWDNRFAICARGDISGLKIAALGAPGWSFVKETIPEFDQKQVPRLAGLTLPAVYRDAELQAVPHLGYNILDDIEFELSLKTDILTKK